MPIPLPTPLLTVSTLVGGTGRGRIYFHNQWVVEPVLQTLARDWVMFLFVLAALIQRLTGSHRVTPKTSKKVDALMRRGSGS